MIADAEKNGRSRARMGLYLLPRALPWAKGVLAFQAVGAFGTVGIS